MKHPWLRNGAIRARRLHMGEARLCKNAYQGTLDPVWLDMMRIHVQTARIYNRHAWRAKGTK